MAFKCDRCGYENENRYLLKRHLERKNICQPKLQDISLDELKKKFEESDKKRDFFCKHCRKSFTEASSMYRHQKKKLSLF